MPHPTSDKANCRQSSCFVRTTVPVGRGNLPEHAPGRKTTFFAFRFLGSHEYKIPKLLPDKFVSWSTMLQNSASSNNSSAILCPEDILQLIMSRFSSLFKAFYNKCNQLDPITFSLYFSQFLMKLLSLKFVSI